MQIGIDLGATKIEYVLLDNNGKELIRERQNSPSDYKTTLKDLENIVNKLDKKYQKKFNVGICHPGSISNETGLLKNAHNSPWLNDKTFQNDISKMLNRNVFCENDANCFALSESIDGSAKHYNIVFGIILGSGCGGGLVVNKKIVKGANNLAGEWGHNPLPWPASPKDITYGNHERPGPPCYCGKSGCIETFLSGPGLALDHGTGDSPKKINALAIQGDTSAQASLKRYENRLGRALSTIINNIDPDAIILGGGLSNIESLYKNVPRIWNQWIFSGNCKTLLLKNVHGDSSGARGAAWLWNS